METSPGARRATTACSITVAPTATTSASIDPSDADSMAWCIFIDSISITCWPARTCWPTTTSIVTIVPCIGAVMSIASPTPETVAAPPAGPRPEPASVRSRSASGRQGTDAGGYARRDE